MYSRASSCLSCTSKTAMFIPSSPGPTPCSRPATPARLMYSRTAPTREGKLFGSLFFFFFLQHFFPRNLVRLCPDFEPTHARRGPSQMWLSPAQRPAGPSRQLSLTSTCKSSFVWSPSPHCPVMPLVFACTQWCLHSRVKCQPAVLDCRSLSGYWHRPRQVD